MTSQTSAISSTAIINNKLINLENAVEKLLASLELPNVWVGAVPPFTVQEQITQYLKHPDEDQFPQGLEGWFVFRPRISHPFVGSVSRYLQEHQIQIHGFAKHGDYFEDYHYIQETTEVLQRTIEFNKSLSREVAEVLDISSSFVLGPLSANFSGTSTIIVYKSTTLLTVSIELQEALGRVEP